MDRVTQAAPAKLNLRLSVGPRRDDGYHGLRSLMVTLDGLEDVVTVRRAERRSVACPGVEGPANLAWAALDALERAVARPLPLAVEITKRIPSRAGLGGGSSDAAATLRAADRLLGLRLGAAALERVAAEVGSDVPFLVRGGAQWAGGRGERLAPGSAPPFAAVLVRPSLGLSTPAVYDRFDRMATPPPDDGRPPPAHARPLAGWARNDLWPPALALAPRLGAPARALRAAGAAGVLLCGSGSCLAGLCVTRDEAEAVAARLGANPAGAELVAVVTHGAAPTDARPRA